MKYILDVHCHTVASGHAYSTLTENINHAAETGLKLIAVTDHSPKMPGSTSLFYFLNLKILPSEINGVELLKGVELNILDAEGTVDLSDKIIKDLDIAIASLHMPCIKPKSIEENTAALVNAARNPLINIIGHPGDPRYPFDIKELVTETKNNNTVLEINNSSLTPNGSRQGGESIILEIIKECKRQNHPIIIGSDAHYHKDIGNFKLVQPLIDEVNMPPELILNTSVELFKKVLNI